MLYESYHWIITSFHFVIIIFWQRFCKAAIDNADYKAVIIAFLIVNLYLLFGDAT